MEKPASTIQRVMLALSPVCGTSMSLFGSSAGGVCGGLLATSVPLLGAGGIGSVEV